MVGEVRPALTNQTNRTVRFVDAAPDSTAKHSAGKVGRPTTLLIVSPKSTSASITLPTVRPEPPSPTAAPPGEHQEAQELPSRHQEAHEQKQALRRDSEEAQERGQEREAQEQEAQEREHGGELKVLQELYEERLRSLSARVRETHHVPHCHCPTLCK